MQQSVKSPMTEVEALQEGPRRVSAGELSPEDFRSLRTRHGIYEQRQPGRYLLRIRIPLGRISCSQLLEIAEVATSHGVRRVHLTTRQNIQLHDLELSSALQIHAKVQEMGFPSLGSGGNTVRNIVIEPLSGVKDEEAFDVGPYALALNDSLSRSGKASQMPRKFKIAFSSSTRDRAGATTTDLGFLAVLRDATPGFRVFIAGGLGASSCFGVELFPWIAASEVVHVAEGVLALFTAIGAHPNRRKTRMRHLRLRLGDAELIRLCRSSIAGVPTGPQPGVQAEHVRDDRQPEATELNSRWAGCDGIRVERRVGRYSVRVAPPHGDLSPVALTELANAAAKFGSDEVHIGLEQEFWITGVRGEAVDAMVDTLQNRGLGTPAERRQLVVACSGAATCRLGVLDARAAANAVDLRLQQVGSLSCGEAIRISGCPNACGRHLVAKLGFSGRTIRVGNRPLPAYGVFVGGNQSTFQTRLAKQVATVAAKRLPDLVGTLVQLGGLDKLGEHEELPVAIQNAIAEFALLPSSIPEDWFADWRQPELPPSTSDARVGT